VAEPRTRARRMSDDCGFARVMGSAAALRAAAAVLM
jgi:hypothetical protein